MKTIFSLVSSVLLLASAQLSAQEIGAKGPIVNQTLPSGPLLHKRAPDYAEWKVTTQFVVEKNREFGNILHNADTRVKENGNEKNLVAHEQKFTKTRSIICAELTVSPNVRWTSWIRDGVQILVWPDGKNCAELTAGSKESPNPHIIDILSTDFPEFTWISSANFREIKEFDKVTCIVFQAKEGSILDQTGTIAYQEVVAYINLDTRLPVAIKRDDQLITYTWNATPKKMLLLPPNVQSLIDARATAMKNLTTRAAAPY